MRQLIVMLALLVYSFTAYSQLTSDEKNKITQHMASTMETLSKSVEGLTDAQLNFKPDTGKWSIKECVYHLALSETNLWGWMQGLMTAPANPEKKASLTFTDDQLLAGIEDRSTRRKTGETFEPGKASWTSKDEAMNFLKSEREKHINYLKTSNEDFRSHIAEQSPLGALDAYQVLLLLSQHTIRHTKQIEEVKATPGYPAR